MQRRWPFKDTPAPASLGRHHHLLDVVLSKKKKGKKLRLLSLMATSRYSQHSVLAAGPKLLRSGRSAKMALFLSLALKAQTNSPALPASTSLVPSVRTRNLLSGATVSVSKLKKVRDGVKSLVFLHRFNSETNKLKCSPLGLDETKWRSFLEVTPSDPQSVLM